MKKQKRVPRKRPPDHPVLLKFKFLRPATDDELDRMAATYDVLGLIFPIVIFVDNSGEARGEKGPFPEYLLAGRTRLAMLERRDIKDPQDAKIAGSNLYGAIHRVQAIRQQGYLRLSDGGETENWVVDTDPELYVLATEVYRRHLTAEDIREAIAAYIERAPQASNREVAKTLGVSHHTVAEVRDESIQNGQFAQIEHLPVERAKAAVRENPGASASAIAKLAKVHRATARKAQKLVAAESAEPEPEVKSEPEPEPEPVDVEQEKKKKVEVCRATLKTTFTSLTRYWSKEIGIDALVESAEDETQAWLEALTCMGEPLSLAKKEPPPKL